MNKLLTSLFAAAAVTLATCLIAAEPESGEKKQASVRALPFRGKIASVDKQANTIKVGERTFQVIPETRIMKAGKAATIAEATVGEEVGGSYKQGADKKLNLVSLRIGARPEAPAKEGK